MNIADLLKLSFSGAWNALNSGQIRPIPANRWTLSIDDERIGNVIKTHTVGADAEGAWSKWTYEYEDDEGNNVQGSVQSWITPNKKHIIRVDGKDVEKDSVRIRVTTVGFPPKGVLIVLHRFVDSNDEPREYRFDARL